MNEDFEKRLEEAVAILRTELVHLKEGLGLLGLKPCGECKRFFRCSDASALFECGETVCYGCLRAWWPRRSPELSVADRENIERKLVRWLLGHHSGELQRRPGKLAEDQTEFRLVVSCGECHGTGTIMGQRCRYCGGDGTVWVVVRKREA